ncbi:hypothetical protein ACE6H2_017616 [Prunus campanulata]
MSVFSGFLGGVCADYFDDEFGLPLPNYKAISTKPKDAENSEAKRGINETKKECGQQQFIVQAYSLG